MADDLPAEGYAHFVHTRRSILGWSQRDLAERAGVKQPLISAIESGRRQPSAQARAALDHALSTRPSVALTARQEQVREMFAQAGLPEPRVFGSVARGDDRTDSDIDLLVEFSDDHDIVDLLRLEHDLEAMLTFGVDLVDARSRHWPWTRRGDRPVTGAAADESRIQRRLEDLAAFGGDAAYTVGLGIETYLEDSPAGRVLRNSGRHILIQVATVAEKLPEDFRDAHDSVDWVALARMRNLIAHHYDKVDDRLVFTALERRIPALLAAVGVTP